MNLNDQNTNERLSKWYNKARLGLFIHWGPNIGNFDWKMTGTTAPTYKTAAEFELAATQSGWSADKWVDAAEKIGASYITLACFHSTCGYIKLWRSAVAGTYCTKRDFLGELIEAAEKKGIKILVYITSGTSWALDHYNKFEGVKWVDPQEYREYKNNPNIDISKKEDFKKYYVRDILDELITNYPKLAGFWYDGWYCEDYEEEIFEFVHSRNPDLLNIKNNYSNQYAKGEDVMSLEDWKGADNFAQDPQAHYGVRYHYNLPNSTSMPPFNREATFKTIGGWKYGDYRPELSEHPDDIKRIITIVSNSWVAIPGYGPLISGDFPQPLAKFHKRLTEFMSWAKESIQDAMGGGHGKGGFPPGYWNDGFSGVTTFVPDKNLHYIHILEAPQKQAKLIISDCGYNVISAVDLQLSKPIEFEQKNGLLYLDFEKTHESDTIIKLTTETAQRIIKQTDCQIKVNDCLPQEDFREQSLSLPVKIKINWKQPKLVCGLKISQPETTAIPDSTRAKDFQLYCINKSGEAELEKSGTLFNQRGMQVISIDPVCTAGLVLKITNNHNNTESIKITDLEVVCL